MDWQLTNLHGDLVATVHDDDPGLTSTHETDEFGVAEDAGERRYGYLGAHQRAGDTPSGLILMGVRLYNSTTGRFLTVDPIYNGSCNRYDYACADPVNQTDLDGKALPAVIIAVVALARAIAYACKISKKWCAKALKYLAKKIGKYLNRAWHWMMYQVKRFADWERTRRGLSCAENWSKLLHYSFKWIFEPKYPGGARVIGYVVGFVYGFATKKRCTAQGKYRS